jgi:hypothetical protein
MHLKLLVAFLVWTSVQDNHEIKETKYKAFQLER